MKGFAVSFSMKREKQDAGDGSLSEKNYTAGGRKKELERELSQCGWELFRMGMQEQYGLDGEKITIERNAHGKPYLPGHPQICFNISHSGEYAACAFASIPIGMDLQQHRRAAWERMAERYFSVEDQKRLAAVENAETLFSGSGPRRRATASGGEPVFRVLLERKRKRASARISVRRKDMKAPSGQRSP